ncbi:MAG: hypothetical protein HW403_1343 [Dehalococcoidia bacterium]|nr:hypothetical protein [Dehalococcoidia bacterium]
MVFRPKRWPGAVMGIAITAMAAGTASTLIRRLLEEPPSLASFVAGVATAALLFLAALFAYWSFCCFSLSYQVDRNRLAIRWGATVHYVPLSSIQSIIPGVRASEPGRIKGVIWPGHYSGSGVVPELGDILFFGTSISPRDLLYVVTPAATYGLSIGIASQFIREVDIRKRMGPTEPSAQGARSWPLATLEVLRDGVVQILFLSGLATNLAIFAYVFYIMPQLPQVTAVRLTPMGVSEGTGSSWDALLLPTLGLFALLGNAALGLLLYRKERVAAYLFLGAGGLVQLTLLIAAMFLLG